MAIELQFAYQMQKLGTYYNMLSGKIPSIGVFAFSLFHQYLNCEVNLGCRLLMVTTSSIFLFNPFIISCFRVSSNSYRWWSCFVSIPDSLRFWENMRHNFGNKAVWLNISRCPFPQQPTEQWHSIRGRSDGLWFHIERNSTLRVLIFSRQHVS